MKWVFRVAALVFATPALAHHEVVAVATVVPLMTGFAALVFTGIVARPRGFRRLGSLLRKGKHQSVRSKDR
ncbi:hypothetical protein [Roseobacter sp.]|uniref:hypothetical protein n=1 Tax=Roseobacter sp. TaxID=1907202 RepID=UPI00385927A6